MFNNNKCLGRVAMATILAMVALAHCSSAKELSSEKIRKSFGEINKYLEKKLASTDVEANLKLVIEMLETKSSKCATCILGGKSSLIETLKMLAEFTTAVRDLQQCSLGQRHHLGYMLDSGLADPERSLKPDYSLTRLDRILDHYALESARLCGTNGQYYSNYVPNMAYAYKQVAYDKLNGELINELPSDSWLDLDENFAKAEEILKRVTLENSALAEAIKQFLDMRLALQMHVCDEEELIVMYKNDLATKFNGHTINLRPLRRVDKLFMMVAEKHAQLCRQKIPKTIEKKLRQLDETTYRMVLSLVSAAITEPYITEMSKGLGYKEVDENFSTPSVVEFINKDLDMFGKFNLLHLDRSKYFLPDQMYFLLIGASLEDPDAKYLKPAVDEIKGELYVKEEKVQRLLSQYLFKSCEEFIKQFGGYIELLDYGLNMYDDHVVYKMDAKFQEDLSLYMVRAGYLICRKILRDQWSITEKIMRKIGYIKEV